MGFDLSQVLSDEKNYSPFICSLCQNLVSLDAIVTDTCSHPFCRKCLEDWATTCRLQKSICSCPTCKQSISAGPAPASNLLAKLAEDSSTEVGLPVGSAPTDSVEFDSGYSLAAHSLQESQPLAFKVLQLIQVSCTFNNNVKCHWKGDYGDFPKHAVTDHGQKFVEQGFQSKPNNLLLLNSIQQHQVSPKHINSNTMTSIIPDTAMVVSSYALSPRRIGNSSTSVLVDMERRDLLPGFRSLSSPSIFAKPTVPAFNILDMQQPKLQNLSSGKPFWRSNSLKDLHTNSLQQGKDVSTNGHDNIDDDEKADNRKNETDYVDEGMIAASAHSAPLTPLSGSRASNISHYKAVLPHPRVDGPHSQIPLNLRNAKTKKHLPLITNSSGHDDGRDSDLETSYSHNLDWNTSINSFGGWGEDSHNNKQEATIPMETLQEEAEKEFELELEPDEEQRKLLADKQVEATRNSNAVTEGNCHQHQDDDSYTTFASKPLDSKATAAAISRQVFERADKLKKQGNAKFNKGDFTAARNLYTEGIAAMSAISVVNEEEFDLLSNMHSNRSVTFFREKRFDKCLEDCDKAIGYDPTYDKSWIRKWRALMALGNCDAAYVCLKNAASTIPDSERLQEELRVLQGEIFLIDQARDLLEKQNFQKARDILKQHSRTSDNIALLYMAARADIGIGYIEAALEKINKSLRFNPSHTEGLELRGHCLFLAGDTEKGAHLLQEAYARNKSCKTAKAELLRCQRTHSAFTKGRSYVKRGRYVEAVEHFTSAILESGSVPAKAPLFSMIRTERAEALLLSRKHEDALRDCDEVISAQNENATAWSVRAEIMIALGKASEAKKELEQVKNNWGADNPTIDDAYRRVDFELRVLDADRDLVRFVEQLERGNRSTLTKENIRRKIDRKSLYDEQVVDEPAIPPAESTMITQARSRRQSMSKTSVNVESKYNVNRRSSMSGVSRRGNDSVNGESRERVRRQSMSARQSSSGENTYNIEREKRRERRSSMGRIKDSDRQLPSSEEKKKHPNGDNRKNDDGRTRNIADNQRNGASVSPFVPPNIANLTNGLEDKQDDRRGCKDKKGMTLARTVSDRHLDREKRKSNNSKRT